MDLITKFAKDLKTPRIIITGQIIGKAGEGDRTVHVNIMPCIGKTGPECQGMAIVERPFGSSIATERIIITAAR